MIYFLANNPIVYEKRRLNPADVFVNLLKEYLPSKLSAFFVCSDSNDNTSTDRYTADIKVALEAEGMTSEKYAVLDNRTTNQASSSVTEAGLIFSAGGYVPTQNAFPSSVGMRELLQSNNKLVIGSSVGSINVVELVYTQSEGAGEAISKDHQRFLVGLGVTQVQLTPCYQETKHHILDGLHIPRDVTYSNSNGRCFYTIYDGGFLHEDGTVEMIYGEAYRIKDGALSQINAENETYQFRKWV